MSLQDYQQRIDDWAQQLEVPYWQPLEIMARLAEETGEVARELNHLYGPKKKKATEQSKALEDEIADVLFTLLCLANQQGIDMDAAMDHCIQKAEVRDRDRFAKKV